MTSYFLAIAMSFMRAIETPRGDLPLTSGLRLSKHYALFVLLKIEGALLDTI